MRIGIVDSGIDLNDGPGENGNGKDGAGGAPVPVPARAAFVLDGNGVVEAPPHPDRVGHGSAVAGIVRALAPDSVLLDAQVFADAPVTNAAVAAAGLRWAVGQGARLVTMSFGLPADRAVLRDAVAEALAAGILLVAASPARGGPVWPAAYPGVIAATGDARCAPGEISVLPGAFGACPRPMGAAGEPGERPRAGGASLSVAHLAGLLAAAGIADPAAARTHLERIARWHGRERRTGPDTGAQGTGA